LKFIRHSGSTTQYKYNAKQRKEAKKGEKEKREKSELKHAYTSTIGLYVYY